MILHYAICDHCSQQVEINKENEMSFQAKLQILPLGWHDFNDDFFRDNWMNKQKMTIPANATSTNNFNLAFCGKQCFIDYVTEKMNDNGMIQLTEDEIQNYEQEQDKNNIGTQTRELYNAVERLSKAAKGK